MQSRSVSSLLATSKGLQVVDAVVPVWWQASCRINSNMTLKVLMSLVLSVFVYQQLDSNDPEGRVVNAQNLYNEYDFIVIGAGSAGSVVANRLTEVSDWKVLLLEAGGDESITSDIPGLAADLQLTNMDWQYKSVPQTRSCLGFTNQQCNFPRGKVLGGSSVLNYMLYVRGNKRDYDSWAADGNTGWSYDEVLPYFIKSEDNRNPYLAKSPYHGTGGYLTVQEAPYQTPLATAFIEGAVEMGYDQRDCNGEQQTGVMFAQGTIRRNSRCSTAKAFLRPVRNRKNLHVSMRSHVHKVLIDPVTKQATGVKFERNGIMYNIRVTKEVIVSTGSIASPQLLMLSGVGPADHLSSLGIPVIKDLPVGNNLQDHIALGGLVFLIDKPYSLVEPRFINLPTVYNYMLNRSSALSVLGGVEGLGWFKTKYADPNDDWPDIQFHFVAGSPISDGGEKIRHNAGVTDKVWNDYYQPIAFKDSWQVTPMLLRPRSAGTVRLRSTDPYDKPVIDPNYLSDDQDLKVLVEGIKIAMALSKTTAMQKLGTKFYSKPFPGCEKYAVATDDYWGCFTKQFTSTFYHTVGTCKMGPDNDPTAVVDPQLRLRGVKGLRIVDTSVIPKITSGNTNAPVIMVAEKASDIIKSSWPHSKKGKKKVTRRSART